jgi:hypothetical protein
VHHIPVVPGVVRAVLLAHDTIQGVATLHDRALHPFNRRLAVPGRARMESGMNPVTGGEQ